jgi:DNA primase
MDGLIPKTFLADLLAKIDIIDVIGSHLQLRKNGSNFVALCPFHTEKSPSFTVSQSKQFYHCFGCGVHGDAIGFLMQLNHLDFVEAVETLAASVGIEVPHETGNRSDAKLESLYTLLSKISAYYHKQLYQSKEAINYINSRKISEEIIQRFQIGYAPNDWHSLQKLVSDQKTQENLITAGILIKKEQKLYDRFRHRIMFPITDHRGRTIGFGGRTIGDDNPKYLNSPETPVFHKGNELYGLYQAKQANNHHLPYIVIVEGYMDAIALAQYGITSTVATLGTATTAKHVQKLIRYTDKIIFCFDGDNAGKVAGWRALENTLPLMHDGIQVAFMFLPENEDPDSQIRQEGIELFQKRIEQALPLSEFFFNHLKADINLKNIDGRAVLAKKAKDLLSKIQDGIFKQLMLEKLASLIHTDTSKLIPTKKIEARVTSKQKPTSIQLPTLITQAINLLLNDTSLATTIDNPEQLSLINVQHIDLLIRLLNTLKQNSDLTVRSLIADWKNTEEAQLLSQLAIKEPLAPKSGLKDEFIGLVLRLYEVETQQTIQQLLQKANNGEITTEEKYKLQNLIIDAKIKIKDK